MKSILCKEYESPMGPLLLGDFQGRLVLCDWKNRKDRSRIDRRLERVFSGTLQGGDSPLLKECEKQLKEYFDSKNRTFDLPCQIAGTEFQSVVWEHLKRIPYGSVCTYRELAIALGRPDALRAVAGAVGANALSLIIPCHRVIGSSGSLTGYAGGLDAKKKLLELEGVKL